MVILQEFSMEYDELRKKDNRFKPDGKAQITGIYESDKLKSIKTFTICYQNTELERNETDNIIKTLARNIAKKHNVEIEEFLINPTGRFEIGGFLGDAGLTGRKIVVDSYQSFANVGGGAFSGKDPTKVDRSGAYKAREIAKKIVQENKEIKWCEVQLAYAIGLASPLSIYIKTNLGDYKVEESLYEECKLINIINDLNLLNENFEERAKFGHFVD